MRIFIIALFVPALAAAQTVYESKDKAGPVFSDVPSAGTKAIHLPPPNVIQTPRPTQQPDAPLPAQSPRAVPSEPVPPSRLLSPVPVAADPVLSPDAVRNAPALRPQDTQ